MVSYSPIDMDMVMGEQQQPGGGGGGGGDVHQQQQQQQPMDLLNTGAALNTVKLDQNAIGTTLPQPPEQQQQQQQQPQQQQHQQQHVTETVLQRDSLTDDSIAAELNSIHGMWEMASILDFLHLFRRQLKISRQFAAAELERVMVTSSGDGGLLADVHMDLMRGISPKGDITTSNWQVNLANKIRFHWRTISDGTPCPFKPEKYLEAVSYAELPASQRVRALHFLCCIRADREDIQLRMLEADRPKTESELEEAEAAAEASRQRAARSTLSLRFGAAAAGDDEYIPEMAIFESLDSFRREPTGVDSSGAAYFYFDHVESTGFRLYKESAPSKTQQDVEDGNDNHDADMHEREDDEQGGEEVEEEVHGEEEEEARLAVAAAAAAEQKMGRKRRERALKKMPLPKSVYSLRDPPPPPNWELIATTVEELEVLGEGLASGRNYGDKCLGRLILDEIAPQIREREEVEESRRRAAERVRSRLCVGGGGGGGGNGGVVVAYSEDMYYDGSGGGPSSYHNQHHHHHHNPSGRSRRARAPVNYAFTEYDDMVKTAIRRSQKRDGSPGEWELDGNGGGGRRSRRDDSPLLLTGEEAAMMGLRRGRSHAILPGSDSVSDFNERLLRQAQKTRSEGTAGGIGGDGEGESGIVGMNHSTATTTGGGGGGGDCDGEVKVPRRRGRPSKLKPPPAEQVDNDGGGDTTQKKEEEEKGDVAFGFTEEQQHQQFQPQGHPVHTQQHTSLPRQGDQRTIASNGATTAPFFTENGQLPVHQQQQQQQQ